jgi:hypothetical protein
MAVGLSLLLAAGCACYSGCAPPASASMTIPTAAPAPLASRPETAPLDLKSLEQRLHETRAVGVYTRIAVGDQVDDVLDQFRAYHSYRTPPLAAMRQSYDLLLLKVLSLLQDTDPALARDIVASHEAIWDIVSDPKKLTESTT